MILCGRISLVYPTMNWLQLLHRAQFHGAARIASSRDRFLWLCSHLLFVICSTAVIYATVTRFFENPTYVVKLASILPIRNFPTVVVCPQVYFLDHKINDFLSKITLPPATNITYIKEVLPQLAAFYSRDVVYQLEHLENIIELLKYNNMDVETAGLTLTATCDETILKCGWRGKDVNCSSLFSMELLSYGFCCVFNGRSLRREFKEPEYVRKTVEKMHMEEMGTLYGLNIAIEQNISKPPINLDLSYKWVSMNNPGYMYADMVANGTPVAPGIELWAGFTTEVTQLTEEARLLSLNLRRCFLTDEPLKYFPEYLREYCILECEMERVVMQCNCILINYPPVFKVPVCGPRELACARSAAVRFGVNVCNCPLACDTETQIMTHFAFPLVLDTPTFDSFYENLNLRKVTILRLYLHGYTKTVYSRRSYYSRVNLFGQLGGVFNIFLGCSILTLLELLFLLRRYIRERIVATNQTQEIWPFTR